MIGSWRPFAWMSRPAGRSPWLLAASFGFSVLAIALGPSLLWQNGARTAHAAASIDTSGLRLLDEQTRVTLSGFRYNRRTRAFIGSATVTNTSSEALTAPLYLVIGTISPPGATVTGMSGLTAGGKPYVDLTPYMPGGVLAPGMSTSRLTLQFRSPAVAPIELELHVYALPANQRPTADAGPDQTVRVGDTVTLDGSGSSDPDGDPLTFEWAFESTPPGDEPVLSDPAAVAPSFTVVAFGEHKIRLVVSDGADDSAPDSVLISTENSPPTACAGEDQTVLVGDIVGLDGLCSSDPDGDPLTFFWSLTAPPGSAAEPDDPTLATPSFGVDIPGTYVAQLIVNDGTVDGAPATVTISTENSRPIADPGPDQEAQVGDTVTMDGSNSYDADGDPLTFQWSFSTYPAGGNPMLDGADTEFASFFADVSGLYVVQLIVHDTQLASDPGTARVEVEVTVVNQRPEFTSTPRNHAIVGVPYEYDADAMDPEGGEEGYSLVDAPAAMTIDQASGLIDWTPGPGDPGDHQITVQAADPEGAAATQDYTLSVYADCTALPPGSPDACAITGLSTDRTDPGSELTILGYGFDPDPYNNRVTVGGAETRVIAAGPEGITVRVPLTGTNGAVTVATPRGTMTGPEFTIERARDFALFASPAAVEVLQGSRRSVQIEIGNAGTEDFEDAVELTAGDLPAGVTLEFLPPVLALGRKGTLLVAADTDAPPGVYTIEVQGTGYTSGISQTRSTAFTLQVLPNPDGAITGLSGRYVTPEGAGIPGVIVRAEPVGAYGTSLGQTVTDAAGDFELRGLPAGILILRIDATPADPGYPIFPVSATVEDGVMTRFDDWVLRHQPPDERFSPIVPGSPQEQVITDPRYPGMEVRLPPDTSIVGWDGVPKTRMAIERIEPDRLPVDPPLIGAKSFFQLFFGTPMGGVPSNPILVTLPNDLGLDPGEKADLWYYDGAPTGEGLWKQSGTGTVAADGSVIVTDPGSGIPRFCGVCGLSCFVWPDAIPNPPCPDCDPQGPPQKAGNPVTLALGMEFPSVVDMQIDGVMPITIGRVYNPWDPRVQTIGSNLGHGWMFSYDVILNRDPYSGMLRMVLPGNSRVNFTPDGSGAYEARNDLRFGGAKLFANYDSWKLNFKDGRVWVFSKFGFNFQSHVHLRTQQRDGKGNSLRIERGGSGRPTRITAPGRSVAIGIGGHGYIEEVRDELGRRVRYSYNAEDRLDQVTAPDGGTTGYSYVTPPPPPPISRP